jgi:hypothetical protein
VSCSNRGSHHGVSDSSLNLLDFFSKTFHDGNSTNGLQSRPRKWLLAFITSMFALSTMYWISFVVLIFRYIDLVNNCIRACYGRDNDDHCLARVLLTGHWHVPPQAWLAMIDSILLVNVSTVQIQSASCPRIICKHPRELTHHLERLFST